MALFKVNITMHTSVGKFGVVHQRDKPYTGTVLLEASDSQQCRQFALDRYLSYTGAVGTINKIEEVNVIKTGR